MNDYSVICVIVESVDKSTVRIYAENLLKMGCHDFAFCGVDKEVWHNIFDSADIDINDEEDWSATWEIEAITDIPDVLCMCKGDVYIFCTDYDADRGCQNQIQKAGYIGCFK